MTNKKKALLVGAQIRGLCGVHNDLQAMKTILEKRGFSCNLLSEKKATRESILSSYNGLIDEAEPDDAIVFYFSGHGGFIQGIERQFILPTNFADGDGDEEFSGILDIELSILLRRLTNKTQNVTVILDCCHANYMSRSSTSLVLKAVEIPRASPVVKTLQRALEKLQESSEYKELVDFGNPNAVRLAATERHRPAYEANCRGLMTQALENLLLNAEDDYLNWEMVAARLRGEVWIHVAEQIVQVEGPCKRILFSTEEATTSAYPVRQIGQELRIQFGRLHGLEKGSIFSLRRTSGINNNGELAQATVSDVSSGESTLVLDNPTTGESFDGTWAVPIHRNFVRRSIKLDFFGECRDKLFQKIEKSLYVRVVTDEEVPELGRVIKENENLQILRRDDQPVKNGSKCDDAGLCDVLKTLDNLARVHHLLSLEGARPLSSRYQLSWGVVREGEHSESPTSLTAGERIFIKAEYPCPDPNDDGAPTALYFGILNIGVTGNIRLLDNSANHGIRREKGEYVCLGERGGLQLFWPEDAPKAPRTDTIVVIVSTTAIDIASLQTETQTARDISQVAQELPLNDFEITTFSFTLIPRF